MKIKAQILILGIIMAVCMVPIAASSQTTDSGDLRILYGRLIDEVITHCDAKKVFSDSRSENIRKAIALSVMKGAFLKTYRDALVEDMLDDSVRPSPATVQHYLNNRFYALID